MEIKYTCHCCGYRTLVDPPNGSFEICPVCFWEDDPIQSSDENWRGGANNVSLKEARNNYKKYGACDLRVREYVRPPFEEEKIAGC